MTAGPWETEPDSLQFEADGLPCVMRRGGMGIWCGYVGVGPEHPLYGLPTNHELKLPMSWFKNRRGWEGSGPFDVFIQALGGKNLDDACRISLAFQVHGGVNWAEDRTPEREPDGRWWFGFDCGHAGDYMPGKDDDDVARIMDEMVDSMPQAARETMRRIVHKSRPEPGDYRDQQYVVAECQSLAAQLNAVVRLIERENTDASIDHRRD